MIESVSLREYFEMQIELRDKALALQATEYERRLRDLNHSHERMAAAQATFLSRERFDQYVVDHTKWGNQQTDDIDKKFASQDIWRAEERGGRNRQATILAVIFAILLAVFKFIPFAYGLGQ